MSTVAPSISRCAASTDNVAVRRSIWVQSFPPTNILRVICNGEFHESSGKHGPRANVGGWHDAGDYGRYVVNSGISTGSVLWAYELFPAKVGNVKLNIPESGNGTPDILNEARFNLEWMLKMQDDDGGVWHKQTSTHFSGFVMPQDDTLPSEVIGTGSAPFKSTCATADLAAVAAIAARVYAPFDTKFAARNLAAAKKAWQWAEQNPNVTFKNPPGVSTGEYGDNNCSDERLWAAAELWRTTGDASYNQYFLSNYKSFTDLLRKPDAESWRQVAPMGLWTYALSTRKGADAKAVAEIKQLTTAAAQQVVEENREKSLSREPADQGLRLGIEWRGGELRHAAPGGECVFAESGVRKHGTR